MMETYEERLKTNYWQNRRKEREEEKMSNYDMDEIERKSRGIRSVELGKDETPHTAVNIELSDDDFRRVAFQAHERDITFNKMVGLILKDGIKNAEYRFEHQSKPQLLNEDK